MTASTYAGWQRRTAPVDLLIMRFLPVDPTLFSVGIFHVPTYRHSGHPPFAGFEHGNLGAKRILVLVIAILVGPDKDCSFPSRTPRSAAPPVTEI